MIDSYETRHAIREANKIDLEDAYFNARPGFDFKVNRNIFGAGFDRAWDKQEERTAKLKQQQHDDLLANLQNKIEAALQAGMHHKYVHIKVSQPLNEALAILSAAIAKVEP